MRGQNSARWLTPAPLIEQAAFPPAGSGAFSTEGSGSDKQDKTLAVKQTKKGGASGP